MQLPKTIISILMFSLLLMFSGLLLADEEKFNQLNEQAAQLFEQEQYEQSLQVAYEAMQLAEKDFGPEDEKKRSMPYLLQRTIGGSWENWSKLNR